MQSCPLLLLTHTALQLAPATLYLMGQDCVACECHVRPGDPLMFSLAGTDHDTEITFCSCFVTTY